MPHNKLQVTACKIHAWNVVNTALLKLSVMTTYSGLHLRSVLDARTVNKINEGCDVRASGYRAGIQVLSG